MVGWMRAHWGATIAVIIGFVIGAIAGAGGKSDSTKTDTVTVASGPAAETVTVQAPSRSTKTVTVQGATRVRTKTQTVAVKPAPPASSGNSYSGNGEKNIGTLVVSRESLLQWHASGGTFGILNDPSDNDTIDVSSQAPSGETTVSAGTYHKVDILAIGDWGFTLVPK
jgi:hypothetical protein